MTASVPSAKRGIIGELWRQWPHLLWLTALWMLLWGQLTILAALTGIAAAVTVTLVFRLPPVRLGGRLHPWYAVVFVVTFVGALVRGSLVVAGQVLDLRRQPGSAVIGVPLRVDDELILASTAIVSSLIPGSLVLEIDRDEMVIWLHVLGVRGEEDIERNRRETLLWEARIVRAFGSREHRRRIEEGAE